MLYIYIYIHINITHPGDHPKRVVESSCRLLNAWSLGLPTMRCGCFCELKRAAGPSAGLMAVFRNLSLYSGFMSPVQNGRSGVSLGN